MSPAQEFSTGGDWASQGTFSHVWRHLVVTMGRCPPAVSGGAARDVTTCVTKHLAAPRTKSDWAPKVNSTARVEKPAVVQTPLCLSALVSVPGHLVFRGREATCSSKFPEHLHWQRSQVRYRGRVSFISAGGLDAGSRCWRAPRDANYANGLLL